MIYFQTLDIVTGETIYELLKCNSLTKRIKKSLLKRVKNSFHGNDLKPPPRFEDSIYCRLASWPRGSSLSYSWLEQGLRNPHTPP